MRTLTTGYLVGLLGLCLAFMGCDQDPSSKAMERHLEQYPDINQKYVYQSLLRIANIDRNPDYEKLIRDVNKIAIWLPPKEDSTYQLTTLKTGLREEGYETLVDVRTQEGQRINLFLKEYPEREHYVALVEAENENIFLEIDGTLALEYLGAITAADQSSLLGLLKSNGF